MKRVLIVSIGAVALWAGACSSGGGGSITPPPPAGPFSNESLNGQYAFSVTGTDASTGAALPFNMVGSFIADGKGDITSGADDVNIFESGSNEFDFSSGSYTIGGNGHGSLSFVDSAGTHTFSITMVSNSNGYLIYQPSNLLTAANGSFALQNLNSFQQSGISGNYAFDLSGSDVNGAPESAVGQLVSNGGGVLSGFADDNDDATINNNVAGAAPISGNYGADPTHASDLSTFGRGLFNIDGVTGVFYIVGPNQVKFMETTSGGTLAGDAFLQTSIPTTAAGISGGFVFVMGGSAVASAGTTGPLARGGKFSASSGSLSSIIVDTNDAGMQSNLSPTTTGTYTIDPSGDGRGTATYTVSGVKDPFSYVFYMISPTQAFIQDQSLDIVEDGSMYAQGSSTISASSLAGNYAIDWSGVAVLDGGKEVGEEDVLGQGTLSSSAALTGNVDINEFATGAQATGVPLTATLKLASDPTSHNILTITLDTNPSGQVTAFAYIAANNNILILTTQTTRIAAGVLNLQPQ
ncbi:MAG: hypothetical protein WCA94_00985 [Candidatus Acidiferrum sp.]